MVLSSSGTVSVSSIMTGKLQSLSSFFKTLVTQCYEEVRPDMTVTSGHHSSLLSSDFGNTASFYLFFYDIKNSFKCIRLTLCDNLIY